MSVGVPIYRRILYGSPAFPEREEKRAISAREREQSIEPCLSSAKDTNPRILQSEEWESSRHTLSALSIHVSYI